MFQTIFFQDSIKDDVLDMGGPPKIGLKNLKWMLKIVEHPSKMDDLGVPLFLEIPIIFRLP